VGTERTICENRKARREYQVEDTLEAGLILVGSEVKSLRMGAANLSDSYVQFRGGEAFLVGAHIAQYPHANRLNHPPRRERKLLLHAHEIRKLGSKVAERGYTVIPLRMYFSGAHAKVLLGLARGKRQHDRRADIRRREDQRDMARALRREERD
jgi:SsrA-binding protein